MAQTRKGIAMKDETRQEVTDLLHRAISLVTGDEDYPEKEMSPLYLKLGESRMLIQYLGKE